MSDRANRRAFLKDSAPGVSALDAGLGILQSHKPIVTMPTVRIDELRQAFNSAYSAGNAIANNGLLGEAERIIGMDFQQKTNEGITTFIFTGQLNAITAQTVEATLAGAGSGARKRVDSGKRSGLIRQRRLRVSL